jgi:hypothetical protein
MPFAGNACLHTTSTPPSLLTERVLSLLDGVK